MVDSDDATVTGTVIKGKKNARDAELETQSVRALIDYVRLIVWLSGLSAGRSLLFI